MRGPCHPTLMGWLVSKGRTPENSESQGSSGPTFAILIAVCCD